MSKPVVVIADELSPATIDALGPDFDIRHCDGTDRAALLACTADAHAILVRSATTVDAEVIGAARRLKVVARAGVGLDNVDVPAATRAGVLVVNAPTSNIVTAAEMACGLLLNVARHIPQADSALKDGRWNRSAYTGVELAEKTLAIVGLGRIGVLVAHRMAAFGMKVVAYDPYVQPSSAAHFGVRLLPLDELLAVADFLTVHLPKTPETVGLLGDEAFHKVKPSVRIVNAARGGIVDEEALAAALEEGRVAGAALDVYATEPCTDSPLFRFDNVVVTPHLGASTTEAQEKAGVAVAKSVRLALAGDLVPDAVNVQGGVLAEEVRPALPLAETLGRIFTSLAGEVPARLDIEVSGEIVRNDVTALELSALKGVFENVAEQPVTWVNAPLRAEEHGVKVGFTTSSESPENRGLVSVRGVFPDGGTVSVAGTLSGPRNIPKITDVDGYAVDVDIADHMLFLRYADLPGVIGTVGRVLGDAAVNIAGMQVARDTAGGEALVVLTVDQAVPSDVVTEIAREIRARSARSVDLAG
ncbi:phosphoglycerate dehydrogenase [Streptomyces sp. NPDC017056]|uniref:phosphoglycerate dehydrogenase n=1 Tax=Streptomyces sp. NPDC017056 TaxID=3364973 RepID=UPI0037AAEE21